MSGTTNLRSGNGDTLDSGRHGHQGKENGKREFHGWFG
jgi:hypothetical protein